MTGPFGFPTFAHREAPDERDIPDHAEALASVLRRAAKLISEGKSAEDTARELLPIIRIAARYI